MCEIIIAVIIDGKDFVKSICKEKTNDAKRVSTGITAI